MFKLIIGPPLWLLCRPRVVGREHVPKRGPAILASNHLAEVDSLCLPLVLRRRLTFVAKSEYFHGAGVRGRLMAWFMRGAGQIAIDRSDPDAAAQALDVAREVIDAGDVWAIYPEGTRSPDGRLYRGHTGVMRVALSRDVPVMPVTLTGTERLDPRDRRGLRPARVTVTIGAPLDLGGITDVREATDLLMQVLQEQWGRTYVDAYARR